MRIGMLWHDSDPKTALVDKITRAAAYYQQKYSKAPTLCFVNPADLEKSPASPDGITIRPSRSVMVNHLWLGIEQNESEKEHAA